MPPGAGDVPRIIGIIAPDRPLALGMDAVGIGDDAPERRAQRAIEPGAERIERVAGTIARWSRQFTGFSPDRTDIASKHAFSVEHRMCRQGYRPAGRSHRRRLAF